MKAKAIGIFRRLRALVQQAAPYLILELLLPGGTLFALLLFVYERRHKLAFAARRHLQPLAAHAKARPASEFLRLVRADGAAAAVWRGRRGVEVIAPALAA